MIREKGVKRDNDSLAVVSADHDALLEYRKLKQSKKKISNINNEVDSLKERVQALEATVERLTSLLEKLLEDKE